MDYLTIAVTDSSPTIRWGFLLSFPTLLSPSTFVLMHNEVITLSEVLEQMQKGERFDIEFVTADKKKGTGGTIKKMGNCILYSAFKSKHGSFSEMETDPEKVSRNPNHFENSTRNIYSLKQQCSRKVHLRLITRFNGKRVL